MYHGVHCSKESEGNFDSVYSVTNQLFCQHLDWLKANGFQAVTLKDALEKNIDKAVVITFDDGDVSNYMIAFKELVARGMLAEFYITTDWINTAGFMSAEQLLEMHNSGMSIQSHGKTHAYLSDISNDELYIELTESKQQLESITNAPVHTIALPGGRGINQVSPIYKNLGYQYLATSVLGKNNNAQLIKRITITSTCDLKILPSLILGNSAIYYKAIVRQFLFNFAKKVLGNRFYDVVRSKLLRES